MDEVPDKSPHSIFEQVWTFTDENYSFFEYKKIDWDSVKIEYEKKIDEKMSEEELFDVLADMLFLLKDGHVNLSADFDRSRNWHWYLDYPPNYDFALLERNYFKHQEQYVGSFILCDFQDVGYVHYRSFGNFVEQDDMDYIINKFKDYKGIIIDVRNNGGGSVSNVYAIAERFVNQEIEVAYEQDKNGPGHEDFTDKKSVKLTPREDKDSFDKPVVILTNRLCYSATNMLVTLMSSLPQLTIIGDKTGGGGGTPTFTELSNGWTLRVSSSRLFTLDNFNVENGIEPDIQVKQSSEDTAEGKDSILEFALNYLRQQ